MWVRALEKLNVVGSSSRWKNESGVGWSNLGVVHGVVSGVVGGTAFDCSVISERSTEVMASDVIGFFFFFVVDDLDTLDAANRVSRLTLGTLNRVMPNGEFHYPWLLSGE